MIRKTDKNMKKTYFESLIKIGSLRRLFLESIKIELGRRRIRNISPLQCLALYTMGKSSLEGNANLAYEELYGLYQSLVSSSELTYILRKLMKAGHIFNKYGDTDKRKKVYVISEKGLVLYDKLDVLFYDYIQKLEDSDLSRADLNNLSKMTQKLQQACKNIILSSQRSVKEQ